VVAPCARSRRALAAVALLALVMSGAACRSRAGAGSVADGGDAGGTMAASSLGALAAASASAAAADASFLHMNSVPASNVFLDGKLIGPTPVAKMQVTPGTHKVLFVLANDESVKRTLSVDVAPGATKAVIVRLKD
jgi:hypothetical protein